MHMHMHMHMHLHMHNTSLRPRCALAELGAPFPLQVRANYMLSEAEVTVTRH